MGLPSRTVSDPAAQQNFEWLAKFLVASRVAPEGVVTASPGCLCVVTTAPATLWQKATGTASTGWVAR